MCGVRGFRDVGASGQGWSIMGCGVLLRKGWAASQPKLEAGEFKDESRGGAAEARESLLPCIVAGTCWMEHACKDGGSCEVIILIPPYPLVTHPPTPPPGTHMRLSPQV